MHNKIPPVIFGRQLTQYVLSDEANSPGWVIIEKLIKNNIDSISSYRCCVNNFGTYEFIPPKALDIKKCLDNFQKYVHIDAIQWITLNGEPDMRLLQENYTVLSVSKFVGDEQNTFGASVDWNCEFRNSDSLIAIHHDGGLIYFFNNLE